SAGRRAASRGRLRRSASTRTKSFRDCRAYRRRRSRRCGKRKSYPDPCLRLSGGYSSTRRSCLALANPAKRVGGVTVGTLDYALCSQILDLLVSKSELPQYVFRMLAVLRLGPRRVHRRLAEGDWR